ncbi:A1S_2505 family phage non-structural protein [Geopseudomonas aromaticivorans]
MARRSIFVFGSNLAGRHGRGAALHARRHHGAIYGQGEGLQGNAYAIPTKGPRIQTLPLPVIAGHVQRFLCFAREHPELDFEVTAIGCGLAGYTPAQIAPLFHDAPANCFLPREFHELLWADPGIDQEIRNHAPQ